MEPITLAVLALTLVATKATEQVGENLGAGAIASAQHLLGVLRRRSPETVQRLETGNDPAAIEAEIIEEVKQVAAVDSEVKAAVETTAAAVNVDQATLQNLTQLAKAG